MSKSWYTVSKVKKGDALHGDCRHCGSGSESAPVQVCKCRATTYYIPGDDLSQLCGDAQTAEGWAANLAAKYSPRSDEFPLAAKYPKQWSAMAQTILSTQIRLHVKPYDEDPNQNIARFHFMAEDEAARMTEDLMSHIASLDVTAPVS
jgi:hypothetical protein